MLSFFVKFMTAGLPEGRLHKWDVTKTSGPRGNRPALPHSRLDWQGLVITHGYYPPAPRTIRRPGIIRPHGGLEPLLPILLRLLSRWSTLAQAPDGDQLSRLPIASVLRAVQTRQGDRSRYFGAFDQKHATMRR